MSTIQTSSDSFGVKRILQISGPVFISLMAQNIIGITDTAFMAHLGEVELGGAGMATLVYFCIYTLGHSLGTGTQIIVARRYGAGQHDGIGRVLSQSFIMLVVSAVILALLGGWIAAPLFDTILSSKALSAVATEYMDIRVWGYLFAFISVVFRAFYLGIARTKVLTYNAFVMAIINIFLDYALIFGHFGLPAMGVRGAALASVIAEAGSLLFYLTYTKYKVDKPTYGMTFKAMRVIDLTLMRTTLRLSVYLMLQALISLSVWTVFFILIEKLGERAMAIASIVRSFYILIHVSTSAYGTSVSTAVSSLIGANQSERIHKSLRTVAGVSLMTTVSICAIIMMFPEQFLRIFTDDARLISETIPSLWVICIAMTISSVGNIYFIAVSATGATSKALAIEMATIIGYLIYSLIVTLWAQAPVHICYTVEIFYYALVGWLSYRFISTEKWRDTKWSQLT